MATYKVIQDIEAEDKLLGPLTFRQFIYAGLSVLLLYLSFLTISKGVGFLAVLFVPPGLVAGFFAWPWGRDQPTEVWALAKVRFLFKPRKRLWDQNGAKQLVTVTAPKKVEIEYTNGLSETEVQSRLQALANTIDSRGWAIKNVNVNLYSHPSQVTSDLDSDRLIAISNIPQATPTVNDDDVHAADDMLDEQNNAQAQRVENMIAASERAHRQQLIQQMEKPTAQPSTAPAVSPAANTRPANYWFMNQPAAAAPAGSAMFQPQIITASQPQPAAAAVPEPVDEAAAEAALVQAFRNQEKANAGANVYGHLHTLQPIGAPGANPQPQPAQQEPAAAVQTPAAPVTPQPNAAILDLAQNDNFNVATIAREAQKRTEPQEVVISLH